MLEGDIDDEVKCENFIVCLLCCCIDISEIYDGFKICMMVDGKRMWIFMVIVFIMIGVIDFIFVIDLILVIFEIMMNGFFVFVVNIFVLMGLC